MNVNNLRQQVEERCPGLAKPLSECDCQFNEETEQTMNKLSQEIAKEVDCFKKDLKDTKNQELDPKNPEHKRILGNIVCCSMVCCCSCPKGLRNDWLELKDRYGGRCGGCRLP